MWENKNACKILAGKPEGNRPVENIGVDRIILKWMLGK
jgi:hypothetical protein